MWTVALAAAAVVLVLVVAGGTWALMGSGDDASGGADGEAAPAPARAESLPDVATELPPVPGRTVAAVPAPAPSRTATAARPAAAPVVWIQAGHADPREPGYRDQTGAGSGPFGSEIGFTTRLADAVIADLEAAGVDARLTPGRVTPWGAPGAAFVSLHHDAPGGQAAVAGAHAGTSENWYRGEGGGDPRPTPYPDSAPHRRATAVSPAVEAASDELARSIAARYRRVFTPGNGAGSTFAGVVSEEANPRMTHYYGFFRTRADARVIVEAGAAGADDAVLAKVDLLAGAIAGGIEDDLRERGLLS